MKKLELNQMENLNGGLASTRACMLLGGLTVLSIFAGGVAALGATMLTVAECA